ncbi:MAG: stage IV sporulation protein A [Clostridia bacterium]|nr:stage IV sporulation protein A [Clostridia bacterium]
MTDTSIYRDIAERTGGDVYIGVVGPVRTGKSTFIKKFMENAVIPGIEGEFERERARDELPQSAGGRTVMTTEPKFIPDEGISVRTKDGTSMRVKLVDCVGYMIPEALGGTEDGNARMVHTPWHENPVPFEEAAEYGTRKVITDHSSIGMLVTTDGTIGEFSRDNYTGVEERVAAELTELGKPFAVILNSAQPDREESVNLAMKLEEKYNAPVALVNCMELNADDIWQILGMLLEEFPAKQVDIELPSWMAVLPEDHRLKNAVREAAAAASCEIRRLRDVREGFAAALSEGMNRAAASIGTYSEPAEVKIVKADAGSGCAFMTVRLPEGLYYDVISEMTGIPMKDETELMGVLTGLSEAKREFDKYREAIRDVNEKGYGIVMPTVENLTLEEPKIVRQSGSYGVKLKASAESIHMVKTNIETEINPIVGTEQQSEEMVGYLMKEFEDDPRSLWESNLFGRSLYDLMTDGLHAKLEHMPEDARQKFGETLSKIINEGSQGLICIIL